MLGIGPTTDKRQIKRAYAARSKEVHPEEKPDEFRMLHEAYQKALKYAGNPGTGRPGTGDKAPGSVRQRGEAAKMMSPEAAEAGEGVRPDAEKERAARPDVCEGTEEAELLSFFREKTRKQEERIAFFKEKWKEIKYEHHKPEVREWWENYLKSEDFHEIQWEPEFVAFLAADMEKQLAYEYEIRRLFWEAYDFEQGASTCKGDAQKLRMALYPVYERQCRQKEREQLEADRQQVNKNIGKLMIYVLLGMLGMWLFYTALVNVNEMLAKKNREEALLQEGDVTGTDSEEEAVSEPDLVKAYLKERYPGTEFSEPVLAEGSAFGATVVYEMHSLTHPDIPFEVTVEHDLIDYSRYRMREDYGELLTAHYAEEYGLESSWMNRGMWPDVPGEYDGVNILYYQDMETLDEFCDTAVRMFREQEELQELGMVGICKMNVCYHSVMVSGGISGYRPGEGQFYRPWELEPDQMEEMIREGYKKYMVYFEPWNLALEQCLEWRRVYEESGEGEFADTDTGFSVSLSAGGGDSCEIYIPVYMCDAFEQVRNHAESSEEMILAGDAYYYLLSEGVAVETRMEGMGFYVEKEGESCCLGNRPRVRLEEIEELIPR